MSNYPDDFRGVLPGEEHVEPHIEHDLAAQEQFQADYRELVSGFVDAMVTKGYGITLHDLSFFAEGVSHALETAMVLVLQSQDLVEYSPIPDDNQAFLHAEHERLACIVLCPKVERPRMEVLTVEHDIIKQLQESARQHLESNPDDTTGAIKAICDERVAIATGSGACQLIHNTTKE